MAKTYIEADSEAGEWPSVVIMDAARSVGGTWAQERLYPGLKTNNTVGSYEFSDFPLGERMEEYGLEPGQHIPGPIVHQYLSDFAEHFGISRLIRFETKADTAILQEDGTWLVEYSAKSVVGQAKGRMLARKIAVATGVTSNPYMPVFPGQEKFRGHVFHSRDLPSRAGDLTSSRSVVVIGGNKSAWDVCYTAARAGAQVHMVVRPSGGGPGWVWRPPMSISRLCATRLWTWFDPAPFGRTYRAARTFLHSTWPGLWLCSLFWTALDFVARRTLGYDCHTANLRPWSSTFWMGNSLSTHNYETDWLDLVRNGQVVVHHAEVSSLDYTKVHLSDGTAVEADSLVACTGWKTTGTINFRSSDPAVELGLSGTETSAKRTDAILTNQARDHVLRQCPELRSNPTTRHHNGFTTGKEPADTHSTSLYRAMVPPADTVLQYRNLAFIGMHQSLHTVMVAQAQALWITAFFDDRIPLLPRDAGRLRYEALVEGEYQRLRRRAAARGRYLDLVFDTLPYVDSLLEDLGVRAKRKASWWRDVFQPYALCDYRGLVREYLGPGSAGAAFGKV